MEPTQPIKLGGIATCGAFLFLAGIVVVIPILASRAGSSSGSSGEAIVSDQARTTTSGRVPCSACRPVGSAPHDPNEGRATTAVSEQPAAQQRASVRCDVPLIRVRVERAIKNRLASPGSLRVRDYAIKQRLDPIEVIYDFTAKNSYGGRSPFVALAYVSRACEVISLGMEEL
jgi:hypothetical protein